MSPALLVTRFFVGVCPDSAQAKFAVASVVIWWKQALLHGRHYLYGAR